jgi:IS30 family transposase
MNYKNLSQVERYQIHSLMKTQHNITQIARMLGRDKTSDLVGSTIIQALKQFEARVKALAYDNGKEFSGHAKIDEALRSTGYFARSFASWERGSNENFNVLLRQYVPKKRQMASITNEEIKMIENRLNNRPRKRLGFRTPAEVFHQSLSRVALRT